ncbi:hypothetical protein ACHAWO_012082 [Cyclotella atomus]|uniref:Uncharacterized protein n=1 Tax=Cyclotella atomus TaxID=382360 RepID=A0ABD3NIE2_9STRA
MSSSPNEQEIAQQKSETYQALSSFHETQSDYDDEQEDAPMARYWECKDGAISYSVPIDPAAGLKRGLISKPYTSNVQIQMNINRSSRGDLQRRGIRLVETIKFDNSRDDTADSMPFVRSIPLDQNADVDAADGSYSLDVCASDDAHLPLLPPSMSAGLNPGLIEFLIEHTIAVSDTERCRCFFAYGDADRDGGAMEDSNFEDDRTNRNYRLLGVVFADEYKQMPDTAEKSQSGPDLTSLLKKDQPASSQSPLDLLRLDANQINEMSEQDKLDALYNAIGKHNENVMANSGDAGQPEKDSAVSMVRYSPSMFNICSGVYLGDMFIREPTISTGTNKQSKGFGNLKSKRKEEKNGDDGFANWEQGVQKTSIQFQWDCISKVIQSYQYGKCLGVSTRVACNAARRSVGEIVVDEGRPSKSRAERRVIWYMDGSYLAGLIGTSYFRAPRYMSFSEALVNGAEPRLTEFMVFYKADTASNDVPDPEDKSYCSISRRLYSLSGSLAQGSTGFFSLTQPNYDADKSASNEY